MARYTGPKTKVSRRYGVLIHGSPKAFENKNYPPGQHGPKGSRRKLSDYALALAEKQKLRYQYGVLERQFRRYFPLASRKRGVTGEILLQLRGSQARIRKNPARCATDGFAWSRHRQRTQNQYLIDESQGR